MFNVDVGTAINIEFTGKFQPRNIKKITSTKEMPAEGRTQFAVAGIGFCDTHEKQTSLSLEYKDTIATTLIKRHGIEEEFANNIAVDICSGFAQDGIKINVLQEEKAPAKVPTAMPKEVKKEDKPKKKGLFSFFKRG